MAADHSNIFLFFMVMLIFILVGQMLYFKPNSILANEERISRIEECDCQKSCFINGTIHADGATWQKDCNRCACVHGEISCRPVECSPPDCRNPVLHPGECCPTCLKQCFLKGVLYEHGDQVSLKQCVECECRDGSMGCTRIDPEKKCPALPCRPTDQFSVPGECCKFCPGVDYCSLGHSCHENATCMNLNTEYTCKCNQGFQGDGISCEGKSLYSGTMGTANAACSCSGIVC